MFWDFDVFELSHCSLLEHYIHILSSFTLSSIYWTQLFWYCKSSPIQKYFFTKNALLKKFHRHLVFLDLQQRAVILLIHAPRYFYTFFADFEFSHFVIRSNPPTIRFIFVEKITCVLLKWLHMNTPCIMEHFLYVFYSNTQLVKSDYRIKMNSFNKGDITFIFPFLVKSFG